MFENNDDWEDRDEYTEEELAWFKQRLLSKREEVTKRLKQHIQEAVGDAQNLPDETDQAQQLSDQAYLVRLADKERKLLKLIDHALPKFEAGEYGFCEGTGDLINPMRLSVRPWTRYSIEYKEERERLQRTFAKETRSTPRPTAAIRGDDGPEANPETFVRKAIDGASNSDRLLRNVDHIDQA